MRNRTVVSFFVLFAFLAAIVLGWHTAMSGAKDQGQPVVLRNVLEFNGNLWAKLLNVKRVNRAAPPNPGQAARTNGMVGLDDDKDASEEWKLEVDPGPGKKPFELSLEDIKRLPRTETAIQFRCIEGWSEGMSFAGVKFSDFMKAYGIEKQNYVGLETPDGDYYVSIDIESMLHEQTLLAYEQNGLPLSKGHGAPLRLAIPIKYGVKNLKRVGHIFFSDKRPPDYWAERGYDWYSGL